MVLLWHSKQVSNWSGPWQFECPLHWHTILQLAPTYPKSHSLKIPKKIFNAFGLTDFFLKRCWLLTIYLAQCSVLVHNLAYISVCKSFQIRSLSWYPKLHFYRLKWQQPQIHQHTRIHIQSFDQCIAQISRHNYDGYWCTHFLVDIWHNSKWIHHLGRLQWDSFDYNR